ncbi:MAG: cbb3-type cytochrome oxidase subunit 3 [Dongiaceae bacterium]|jgi:cbb3-type cytochrome oxidase subunit 3
MSGADLQFYAFAGWMILSMITFIAIIVWSLLPSHRRRFESYAAIPLRDDEKEDRP